MVFATTIIFIYHFPKYLWFFLMSIHPSAQFHVIILPKHVEFRIFDASMCESTEWCLKIICIIIVYSHFLIRIQKREKREFLCMLMRSRIPLSETNQVNISINEYATALVGGNAWSMGRWGCVCFFSVCVRERKRKESGAVKRTEIIATHFHLENTYYVFRIRIKYLCLMGSVCGAKCDEMTRLHVFCWEAEKRIYSLCL